MTITGGSALSKDDIDKMIHDAEQYAEEDRQRKDAVEIRNQAESAVYTSEKFLAENADKIPDDVKGEVETDVADLKKALEDDDTESIKAAAAELAESSQKMGAAMYANAQATAETGAAGAPGAADAADADSGEGDVVDAEIVDEGGTESGAEGGAEGQPK